MEARSTRAAGTPDTVRFEAAPRYVPMVRSASWEMSTMQRPVPVLSAPLPPLTAGSNTTPAARRFSV